MSPSIEVLSEFLVASEAFISVGLHTWFRSSIQGFRFRIEGWMFRAGA